MKPVIQSAVKALQELQTAQEIAAEALRSAALWAAARELEQSRLHTRSLLELLAVEDDPPPPGPDVLELKEAAAGLLSEIARDYVDDSDASAEGARSFVRLQAAVKNVRTGPAPAVDPKVVELKAAALALLTDIQFASSEGGKPISGDATVDAEAYARLMKAADAAP